MHRASVTVEARIHPPHHAAYGRTDGVCAYASGIRPTCYCCCCCERGTSSFRSSHQTRFLSLPGDFSTSSQFSHARTDRACVRRTGTRGLDCDKIARIAASGPDNIQSWQARNADARPCPAIARIEAFLSCDRIDGDSRESELRLIRRRISSRWFANPAIRAATCAVCSFRLVLWLKRDDVSNLSRLL